MLDWITSLTGDWGPALIEFYKQNAIWINIIVLVYGAVMLMAWRNLDRMQSALVDLLLSKGQAFAKRIKEDGKFPKEAIPVEYWEEAYGEQNFALLARQSNFSVHKTSLEKFIELTTPRDLRVRIIKLTKK